MKRAPSARMKRPLQAMKTTGQHRLLTPGNLLVVALSAGMWAAAFMLPGIEHFEDLWADIERALG